MTSAMKSLLLYPLNVDALNMCIIFLNNGLISNPSTRKAILKACRKSAKLSINKTTGYIIRK